jgi:hypothetical protein
MLANRCQWFKGYSNFLLGLAKEGSDLTGIVNFRSLFEMLLIETGHLCERSLRTTFSDSPPPYLVLSSLQEVHITVFNFSGKKSKTPPGILELTLEEALTDAATLRACLENGLGLRQGMHRIIDQQGYVLTPDFALKLLILNERFRLSKFC